MLNKERSENRLWVRICAPVNSRRDIIGVTSKHFKAGGQAVAVQMPYMYIGTWTYRTGLYLGGNRSLYVCSTSSKNTVHLNQDFSH